MAKSLEDVEVYLRKLDRPYEVLDDGTVLVAGAPDQPPVALRFAPPVAVVQAEIGAAEAADEAQRLVLYTKLLELNAAGLLHAAYGLERGKIVLSAAMELDNLDLNELEAVLADVDVALAEHVPALRKMAAKVS